MTAGWCSRTVRAAVFAAVCVLLAALGHVMMSGSQVPGWALAVGLTVTGAAGWCLAGRERGLPLIVTVVVAAQTALHSAFSFAQSVTGSTAPMDMSDMGAVHMDMASIKTESIPVWFMTISHMGMSHTDHMGHSTDGGSSTFGMLAAHLLAALLSGLRLRTPFCGRSAASTASRGVRPPVPGCCPSPAEPSSTAIGTAPLDPGCRTYRAGRWLSNGPSRRICPASTTASPYSTCWHPCRASAGRRSSPPSSWACPTRKRPKSATARSARSAPASPVLGRP